MSEQTPASFGDNKDTWRTATLVTGFALLISMAANFGGPSSAHASADNPNQLQIAQMSAQQSLSIGGFTTLDQQPAFIVLNANGQRIGKLPMNLTPQTGDAESIGE
tara:strand:- start:20046 stop:20363 length:318 start_codon:yes stop_codon:yes gene_type:complete